MKHGESNQNKPEESGKDNGGDDPFEILARATELVIGRLLERSPDKQVGRGDAYPDAAFGLPPGTDQQPDQ